MSTKSVWSAAFLAAAMVVAPTSMAQQMQERGWYVGGSFGQSQADLDCSGTTSCDDSDTSWKIFGGYQINRNFAVELAHRHSSSARC